jgi:hypothetical protein
MTLWIPTESTRAAIENAPLGEQQPRCGATQAYEPYDRDDEEKIETGHEVSGLRVGPLGTVPVAMAGPSVL